MATARETVRDLAARRGLRLMKARPGRDHWGDDERWFVVNAYTNMIVDSMPVSLERAREMVEEYVTLKEWERTPVGETPSGKSAR